MPKQDSYDTTTKLNKDENGKNVNIKLFRSMIDFCYI